MKTEILRLSDSVLSILQDLLEKVALKFECEEVVLWFCSIVS